MKCLMKYQWVKLPRNHLPEGNGVMGAWAKLASRAAFRKGQASYCGHINSVRPGMWSGGVVGLKSILGLRSRAQSLETLNKLSELGFVSYKLDSKTKKLNYEIKDWVINCSGAECMDGQYMPQRVMASSASLVASQTDLYNRIMYLRKQTHGLTSGATRYPRTRTMRFLFWHRQFNLADTVPL